MKKYRQQPYREDEDFLVDGELFQHPQGEWVKYLDYKAELNEAVKQEREECAKSIDSYIVVQRKIHDKMDLPEYDASFEACMTVLSQRAEAIRQRSE